MTTTGISRRVIHALIAFLAVAFLVTACGDDDNKTDASGSNSSSSSAESALPIDVDMPDTDVDAEAFVYLPKQVTATPGSTLEFTSHFRGEPHTVAFGTSIDKTMDIFNSLTPEEQQSEGPPPQEFLDLKLPFVFPDEGDPTVEGLNQSAAQPCFLATGTAPGKKPCEQIDQPAFDGSQPLYNSGILADGKTFEVTLADDLKPGTYQYMCLVHGPEMIGSVVVTADETKAETAHDVATRAAAESDKIVKDIEKAIEEQTKSLPEGTVQAAAETEAGSSMQFFDKDITVPVGGKVTWNMGFHTVTFNFDESDRTDVTQASDGTWSMNQASFKTEPEVDVPEQSGSGSSSEPVPVDGGSWDGTGFHGFANDGGPVAYTLTFTKEGSYTYACMIHPDMTGTVTVTG